MPQVWFFLGPQHQSEILSNSLTMISLSVSLSEEPILFPFLHLLLPNFTQAGNNHNNWKHKKEIADAARQDEINLQLK